MKTYEMDAKSVTPTLWNRIKRELMMEIRGVKKNKLAEWEEKNWPRKAEFDGDGNVLLPPEWLKKCFVEACQGSKVCPYYHTTAKETYTKYMQACIFLVNGSICKKEDLEPYGAYVNPNPGGRGHSKVWKIRPMLKNWKASFVMKDPMGRMLLEELKEIAEYAGMMIGIGDGRVMNFGRFEVTKIKEVK